LLLEIVNLGYGITNNAVTINGQHVEDGIIENSEDERKFEIKNSHISRALIDVIYKTDKGDLLIEQEINWGWTYGDKVFKNLSIAPDGKYRLGFMKRLYVRNGRIVKKIVYNAS
jgi:hypothetical protein